MSEWSDWPWVVASYLLTWAALATYGFHILRRLARTRKRVAWAEVPQEERGGPRPGPWSDHPAGTSPGREAVGGIGQEGATGQEVRS